MTNPHSEALKEFNSAFKPKVDYLELLLEEFNEWYLEFSKGDSPLSEVAELKELCDVLYTAFGVAEQERWNLVVKDNPLYGSTVQVIADYGSFLIRKNSISLSFLIQSLYSYGVSKGWDVDEAFKRVHQSNMSKLGTDGQPVLDSKGKVTKGPNYQPPQLKDLV